MSKALAANLNAACFIVILALSGGIRTAAADIVISTKATANMDCGGGFCEPTAFSATLNVKDLKKLVARDGNVTVATAGQNVDATNIVVKAGFATPDSTSLTLDATGGIAIGAPVSIGGSFAQLQLQSETGGTLGDISFGRKGHITFASTSDLFNINGGVFVLEATLPDLAKAANANPSEFYALTNSYDASADGTYHAAPISTTFTGYFEALGNAISNLSISVTQGDGEYIGLFADISGSAGFGVARNLRLANAGVVSNYPTIMGAIAGYVEQNASIVQSSATGTVEAGDSSSAGGIAGSINLGSLVSSWSSAKVSAGNNFASVGGLAGAGDNIANSYATGSVTGGESSNTGGLVGLGGEIIDSFATGDVSTTGGGASAGGLVGNGGDIENSYAEGNVSGASGAGGTNALGGLIGYDDGGASASYSTGMVTGVSSDLIGGVVGMDISPRGSLRADWDTTTSGISRGAGRLLHREKLTGLTNTQLSSGLPPGFRKGVWRENAEINNGFPYLIDNPPPK